MVAGSCQNQGQSWQRTLPLQNKKKPTLSYNGCYNTYSYVVSQFKLLYHTLHQAMHRRFHSLNPGPECHI